MLYTACRRNEILYLRREDLDLVQRILSVRISKTKRTLQLPINQALFRIIQEMEADGQLPEEGFLFTSDSPRKKNDIRPWHPSSVTHWFKTYLRKAGLSENYSLHSCRHTYVTFLRSQGISQDIAQRLVGHTTPATTDAYDSTVALHFRHIADLVDFEGGSGDEE